MKSLHFFVYLLSALLLTACNSGESNNPALQYGTKTVQMQGYVVDGYIRDADVCIDKNYNTICDATEPKTKSTSSGSFSLPSIEVLENEFLFLNAYDGVDTSTNKNFQGHLRAVIAARDYSSSERYVVSPVTDLVASHFFDSSSRDTKALQSAQDLVAYGFQIDQSYLGKNLMQDVAVFVVGQDIQQSKAILEEVALRAKAFTLTSPVLKELRSDIKRTILRQIEKNSARRFKESGIIATLESFTDINVSSDIENFVEAQLPKVREAIYDFNKEQRTQAELKSFQIGLEVEVDKIKNMVRTHTEGSGNLVTFTLDINLSAELEPSDDTNTSQDTNSSVEDPQDQNTSLPSTPEEIPTVYNIEGVFVDGYVENGAVFLDANNNGVLDSDETTLLRTSADGSFSFSGLTLEQDTFYTFIGVEGKDTFTTKNFTGKFCAILHTSEDEDIESFVLSPLSDLVCKVFLKSAHKVSDDYTYALSAISGAFVLDSQKLLGDPVKDKQTFTTTIGLEQIRIVLEEVAAIAKGARLTLTQKEQIKEALLEQILASGYHNLNLSRILITIEAKLGFLFNQTQRTFSYEMVRDIQNTLKALYEHTAVEELVFPRMQYLLDKKVEERLASMQYKDFNLSAETVSFSKYDKNGASYDKNACLQGNEYTKMLQHSSALSYSVSEDTLNGLGVGFDDVNQSDGAVAVYYAPLALSKKSETTVVFQDNYFLSYDKAWIKSGQSVYLQSPQKEDGFYDCYRVKLDQEFGINVDPIKVYRFTDE